MATKNKNEYARKWRATNRESHRLRLFTMGYIKSKYPKIQREIQQQFDYINARYPSKRNLTITAEFTSWKNALTATAAVESNQDLPAPTAESNQNIPADTVESNQNIPAVTAESNQNIPAPTAEPNQNIPAATAESNQNIPADTVESNPMETTEILGTDLDLGSNTTVYNRDPWLTNGIDQEIEKNGRRIEERPRFMCNYEQTRTTIINKTR